MKMRRVEVGNARIRRRRVEVRRASRHEKEEGRIHRDDVTPRLVERATIRSYWGFCQYIRSINAQCFQRTIFTC